MCRGTSHYSVLLGNGDGSFRSEQIFASGSWSRDEFGFGGADGLGNVFAADFDGDGKLDILDRHYVKTSSFPGAASTVTMELRLGNGDGTFGPAIAFADPGNLGIALDLNRDRLADVVVTDTTSDIDVLLTETPTTGADVGLIQASASPEPAGVGQNLTYSVIVLNEGPESATGVTFTDNLPSAMTFVSTASTGGSCEHTNLVVTCNVGSLAKGAYAQITVMVAPSAAGTFTNTMTVKGNETDGSTGNNNAEQTSTVKAVHTLTVVKSGTGAGTVIASHGFGSGINCGSVCSAKYLEGTVVSVSEDPDAHSTFDSWSGACTGQACSVTMDGDKTVTAAFVEAQDFQMSPSAASLSVTWGGQASESVSVAATGGFAAAVTLTCRVSGSATGPACSMSPNSVVAGGSATLTVTAATLSAAPRDRGHQKMSWWEHLLRACRSGWWLVCLARQSIRRGRVNGWRAQCCWRQLCFQRHAVEEEVSSGWHRVTSSQ